jgi:hypothetical protein
MNQKHASWTLLAVTLVFGAAFMWATEQGWGHEPEKGQHDDNRQTYGVLMTLFVGSATSIVQLLAGRAKGKTQDDQ